MGLGAAFGLATASDEDFVLVDEVACAAEFVAHPATKVKDKARAKAEADRIE